ncbi:MAG: hypothetical protein QJR00_07525, partial [Bacillota bacterium]|nr:hypothetical protein [Bacillota bacterium]
PFPDVTTKTLAMFATFSSASVQLSELKEGGVAMNEAENERERQIKRLLLGFGRVSALVSPSLRL